MNEELSLSFKSRIAQYGAYAIGSRNKANKALCLRVCDAHLGELRKFWRANSAI